jgi:SAM-dependent methyltransferase
MSPPLTAKPLEPAWVDLVDALAPRVLGRDDRTGEALAAEVRRVSELYTRERYAMKEAGAALAARLRFFLLRDLPKIQGPLAELGAVGALPAGPTWRILDVGAGLGTSTLGAAALAKELGIRELRVLALEREAAALDVFKQLARAASQAGLTAPIALEGRAEDLEELDLEGLPVADLILVGLSLNELHAGRADADRLDQKEAALRALASRLAPGGSLVVIEPALKTVSRELQSLRDRFMADAGAPHVFSPCLRDGPCPLLRRERDWCHDQLGFELPPRLAELARASGLRYERLTHAQLVLRNDDRRLWNLSGRDPRTVRVVGGPIVTKGKLEWDGCGAGGLVRLRRMDRERTDANACMDDAARGAILRLDRDVEDGGQLRLRPDVAIERLR